MIRPASKLGRPLQAGTVFRYSYLWHREYLAGRREASKDRPAVALAVAVSNTDGQTHVLALPITHSQPTHAHHGVKLPDATKRILELDDFPSWIITIESVRFAWPGPDVRPAPRRTSPIYGVISRNLLQAIAQSYLANRKRDETVSFDRDR